MKKATYVNGNENIQLVVSNILVQFWLEFLRCVGTHDQGVLRELFEETLGRRAFDVEVEGLDGEEERAEREEGDEGAHLGRVGVILLASFFPSFLSFEFLPW